MRFTDPAPGAFDTGYVVTAPRAGDAVSGALRRAFATADLDTEPFADLMRKLDAIEFPTRRT